MSYLQGKFVWFEHHSADTVKARKFYESLFGWHTELMPMGGTEPYPMIMNGEQGIGGFGAVAKGQPSLWMSYLSVDDVDAKHGAAVAAGATSLMPPTDFGPVGRGAALRDPTGAVFSVWKSADGDRADDKATPPGNWYWNELMTPDEKKSLAFYEKVFGFSHDSMDMGAQGMYHVLKKDGVMRAGLLKTPMPEAPPMWLPYVAVADCDASAAKAQQLGAKLVSPPTDIPNVGRFAVLVDPLGVAVAVMKPAA